MGTTDFREHFLLAGLSSNNAALRACSLIFGSQWVATSVAEALSRHFDCHC